MFFPYDFFLDSDDTMVTVHQASGIITGESRAALRPSQTTETLVEDVGDLARCITDQDFSFNPALFPDDLARSFERLAPRTFLARLASSKGVHERGTLEELAWAVADVFRNDVQSLLVNDFHPDVARKMWVRIRAYRAILTAWIFPPGRASRRIPEYVYKLSLLLSTLAGVLFIACHRETPVALKSSRALPGPVQRHLLGVAPGAGQTALFLDEVYIWLQRSLALTGAQRGAEYVWMAQTEMYFGFLAERRERKAGLVSRFIEHELYLIRQQRRQLKVGSVDKGTAFRYQVFSVFQLHSLYFLPVFLGSAVQAYNREQMSIRLLPTKTNVRGSRPAEIEKRPCRADHAWERRRARRPVESEAKRACRLNFDNLLAWGGEEQEEPLAPAWFRMHYSDCYDAVQTARLQQSGEVGPINILDGQHSSLGAVPREPGEEEGEVRPRVGPEDGVNCGG